MNSTIKKFEVLAAKIGPLRYQVTNEDCVPVTLINALLFLSRQRLHPKLVRLIWTIGIDQSNYKTGWVASYLLADLLKSWSEYASKDDQKNKPMRIKSQVITDESVNLEKDGLLMKCLDSGGVACITIGNGDHYAALLGYENGDFIGFDSLWKKNFASPMFMKNYSDYCGLVNSKWKRNKLLTELKNNKWAHLISKD